MIQNSDEILRVLDDWGRNLAPAEMKLNEKNGIMLIDYCTAQFGTVTAGGLTHAYNALRDRLDLVPQVTQAQLAEKLEARMRRDFAESIKSQTTLGREEVNRQKADSDKKNANDKEYKTLLSQIEYEISNFCVGHASGHLDYSRTESGRDALRKVRDSHDRRTIAGAKLALSAIRAAKAKLS